MTRDLINTNKLYKINKGFRSIDVWRVKIANLFCIHGLFLFDWCDILKKKSKTIILSSCKLKQFHFEVCVPENDFLNELSTKSKWKWIVKLSATAISSTELAARNL